MRSNLDGTVLMLVRHFFPIGYFVDDAQAISGPRSGAASAIGGMVNSQPLSWSDIPH